MAPTPPRANLLSQLMRVWVSEPSSLSKRPETFERKILFFTSRFLNFSGVKMTSSVMGRSPRRRATPPAAAPARSPWPGSGSTGRS